MNHFRTYLVIVISFGVSSKVFVLLQNFIYNKNSKKSLFSGPLKVSFRVNQYHFGSIYCNSLSEYLEKESSYVYQVELMPMVENSE